MNIQITERAQSRALELFAAGYNCSEAVLQGVAEAANIQSDAIVRIATGFGAGIGRSGEICGALAGATMAVGLAIGRKGPEDKDARERVYGPMSAILDNFKEKFGSIRCIELTGCDLRTEEGRKMAAEIDLHGLHCPKFVALAAKLAARAIELSISK